MGLTEYHTGWWNLIQADTKGYVGWTEVCMAKWKFIKLILNFKQGNTTFYVGCWASFFINRDTKFFDRPMYGAIYVRYDAEDYSDSDVNETETCYVDVCGVLYRS